MARRKTISGEVITITETRPSSTSSGHWYLVQGTAQGVIDFLDENKIPEHKVKQFVLDSSIWYAWYHK